MAAKKFSHFVAELYAPRAEGERRFVAKHGRLRKVSDDDGPVVPVRRAAERHGYDPGDDAKVYETTKLELRESTNDGHYYSDGKHVATIDKDGGKHTAKHHPSGNPQKVVKTGDFDSHAAALKALNSWHDDYVHDRLYPKESVATESVEVAEAYRVVDDGGPVIKIHHDKTHIGTINYNRGTNQYTAKAHPGGPGGKHSERVFPGGRPGGSINHVVQWVKNQHLFSEMDVDEATKHPTGCMVTNGAVTGKVVGHEMSKDEDGRPAVLHRVRLPGGAETLVKGGQLRLAEGSIDEVSGYITTVSDEGDGASTTKVYHNGMPVGTVQHSPTKGTTAFYHGGAWQEKQHPDRTAALAWIKKVHRGQVSESVGGVSSPSADFKTTRPYYDSRAGKWEVRKVRREADVAGDDGSVREEAEEITEMRSGYRADHSPSRNSFIYHVDENGKDKKVGSIGSYQEKHVASMSNGGSKVHATREFSFKQHDAASRRKARDDAARWISNSHHAKFGSVKKETHEEVELVTEGYDEQNRTYMDRTTDTIAQIKTMVEDCARAHEHYVANRNTPREPGSPAAYYYAGDWKFLSRQVEDLRDQVDSMHDSAVAFLAAISED
jgi:hypothetical protein